MNKAKVQLFTTVWGEWHLDMFEHITLPTLLADANLPALAQQCDLNYTIYTRDADCARLAEMPIVRLLAQVIETSIVSLTGELKVDISSHMTWWAALIEKAKRENAFVLAVQPDAVWADRAFARIFEVLAAGKKAVQIPNFRIVSETSVEEIRQNYGVIRGHPIRIPARDLMGIGIRHMHPLTMAEICGMKPAASGQDRLWPVPGEGFVSRSMGREILFFDPQRCTVNKNMFSMDIVNFDDIAVLGDSEEFVSLNLTPLAKDLGLLQMDYTTDLDNPAKWSIVPVWDTPTADELGRYNIRYTLVSPTTNKWRSIEERVEKEFSTTLRMRRLIKAWKAIQACGCAIFAELFAMAIQVTDVVDTMVLEGNETLLAPSDNAMALLHEHLYAELCTPGNERKLSSYIGRHIGTAAGDDLSSIVSPGGRLNMAECITIGSHRVRVLSRPLIP